MFKEYSWCLTPFKYEGVVTEKQHKDLIIQDFKCYMRAESFSSLDEILAYIANDFSTFIIDIKRILRQAGAL